MTNEWDGEKSGTKMFTEQRTAVNSGVVLGTLWQNLWDNNGATSDSAFLSDFRGSKDSWFYTPFTIMSHRIFKSAKSINSCQNLQGTHPSSSNLLVDPPACNELYEQ